MPTVNVIDRAEWDAVRRRMQERRWLLAATCIVGVGLLLTFQAKVRGYGDVTRQVQAGRVVNLSTLESSRSLEWVLGRVYADAADRRLAAMHVHAYVARRRDGSLLPWRLPNVGQLNTEVLALPASRAALGGPAFRAQAAAAGPHGHVPVLDAAGVRAVKPYLVVRSPADFGVRFWGLALIYVAAFYAVHLFWLGRRFGGDPMLLPVVHLLTGLALLLLFSLQDPLRDSLYAQGFVGGVGGGLVLLASASRLDFQHGFWRRRPFLWLIAAGAAAVVLYRFGAGPTGSSARVNLYVPLAGSIQPVEFIKGFVAFFLAGYFARHWTLLRGLQQRSGLPAPLHRLNLPRYRDLLPVAAGMALVLAMFYLLQDMGPALVIGCTFLVLYGIVRGRWPAVGAGFCTLVAGFLYAYRSGAVPVVAGRIEMLLSPWENFVRGGEHLAHAYWALAVGGATGQGWGQGSPSYIPAAHTDMVLAALGEEVGLIGLVAVLVLYAVLLHRALHVALRAGGVYSLFLGLSITLMLLFQMMLIAGGTLGLVPLSGVVTPFLSYGKSSMLCNLAMIGVLASLSARPGTAGQRDVQARHFAPAFRVLRAGVLVLIGVLAGRAAYIQLLAADAWAIRPALVVRSTEERAFTYNPRVFDARRRLTRGTIYDRNGIPLATSRPGELARFRAVYAELGVAEGALAEAAPRHYPFGALTFYLLGDLRTRVKWGADNSLYAEHRYHSHLRGYDNLPRRVEQQRRPGAQAAPLVRYDYAALLPLLRGGGRSAGARRLVHRDRDLYLTLDVRLQRGVAEALARTVPPGKTASAVVLDVATGDVLASVTYPLPEAVRTNPSAAHRDKALFDRGFGRGAKPPGSTLKLVTALAALNRDSAAIGWALEVHPWDRYARRGEPEGRVTLHRALVASSNVYFAALARDVVGSDTLLQALEAFGFRVGSPGLTRTERLALMQEPDNLRQLGFGQGPVAAGPLQVALVAATIAAGGRKPSVRWVLPSAAPSAAPSAPPVRVLAAGHAAFLAAAMRGVVTDREGTARGLQTCAVPVAGKTGTAEEVRRDTNTTGAAPFVVNHAWFTGFAPYVAGDPAGTAAGPQVAVAVLVEEGGHGGAVAAPAAAAIFEEAAALGIIRRTSRR